jgi:copper chaperone CopZ
MTTFKIMNLRCGGCASTITNKVLELDGVDEVKVNIEGSEVMVNHTQELNTDIIAAKLKKLGYPTEGEDNDLMTKAKGLKSCMIGKLS